MASHYKHRGMGMSLCPALADASARQRQCALVMMCVLCGAVLAAQTPVEREPHHRVLFENRNLRLLDVNIGAGDTALDHLHAHDVLTVSLSASETRVRTPGAAWGEVRPPRRLGETNLTEYAGQPGTHAVQNVGNGLFRLIAVENLKRTGWTGGSALTGAGTTLVNEARAFRAYSVQLGAGLREIDRRHGVPTVAVLVAGDAMLSRTGASPVRLDRSRRWVVIAAGDAYKLTAQGSGAAHLVEIEVR